MKLTFPFVVVVIMYGMFSIRFIEVISSYIVGSEKDPFYLPVSLS
jgi:hypothetical protein